MKQVCSVCFEPCGRSFGSKRCSIRRGRVFNPERWLMGGFLPGTLSRWVLVSHRQLDCNWPSSFSGSEGQTQLSPGLIHLLGRAEAFEAPWPPQQSQGVEELFGRTGSSSDGGWMSFIGAGLQLALPLRRVEGQPQLDQNRCRSMDCWNSGLKPRRCPMKGTVINDEDVEHESTMCMRALRLHGVSREFR